MPSARLFNWPQRVMVGVRQRRRKVLRDKFAFDGIERIERRLLRVADEVGYVVLLDRSDYSQEIRLGRLDLDQATTAPWHRDAAGDGAGPASLREQARALCAWLHALAAESLEAVAQRRFRVKVFSPKGYRMVFSSQFAGRNEAREQEREHQAEDAVVEHASTEPDREVSAARPVRHRHVLMPLARGRTRQGATPRPHSMCAHWFSPQRPSAGVLTVRGPRSGPPPRSSPPARPGRAPPTVAVS